MYLLYIATLYGLVQWNTGLAKANDLYLINFIADYFTYKYIKMVTLFTCSDEDSLKINKKLSSRSIWSFTPGPEQKLSTLEVVAMQTYYKYGIFLDYMCPESRAVLKQNSERHYLNASYYWLIWGPNSNMFQVVNALNLSLDSEFIWSCKDISTGKVLLHDVYKINYTWPAIVTPAGYWEQGTGLHYNISAYKYERRKNLQGLVFNGGLAVLSNWSQDTIQQDLLKPENQNKDTMATFNYATFQFLMKQFNFSVKLTLTNKFGFVVDNGRYEGLTKLLGDGEVDIDVSGLFISHPRYKYMTYTVHTWKFISGFIFRHPVVTDGFDALIKPFSYKLWICASITWLCIMLILRFISWAHSEAAHKQPLENTTWSDAFVAIMGTVGQQGVSIQSSLLSWRAVFITLLLVTLLIDTYYASSIVFYLIQEPKRTIRTTRDLLESNLLLGAENVSYNVAYFEVNTDPLIRELFNKKMFKHRNPLPEYYTVEEGARKVLNEGFGFHSEFLKIYRIIEKMFPEESKCSLAEVIAFTPEYAFIPLPWNSSYKELITIGLRRAHNFGLMNYLNRKFRPPLPACFLPGNEVVAVGLHTVVPAFGIMLAGILCALMILQVERFKYNRYEKTMVTLRNRRHPVRFYTDIHFKSRR